MPTDQLLLEYLKGGLGLVVALASIYVLWQVVTKTIPDMMHDLQKNGIDALNAQTSIYSELTKHQLSLMQANAQLIADQLVSNTAKLDLLVRTVADNTAATGTRRAADRARNSPHAADEDH